MSGAQRGGILFRLMVLMVLALLLAAVYLARHPLLRLAGRFWEVEDRLERADAILVLGDDNFAGDRASRSAELFRAGWAPLVVVSGRLLRPYAGVAELMSRDLETRDVPQAAILRFPHRANNTREEAQALRELVTSRGWRQVLLVTSNYHTRRARYIFRRVFPPQVAVRVVSVRDTDFDPDSWWESRQGRKLFLLETAAYFTAVWELWRRDSGPGANTASAPSSEAPEAQSPAGRAY
jgi:uncharacterized SAM-binding protein YcdF (DUF218 family)